MCFDTAATSASSNEHSKYSKFIFVVLVSGLFQHCLSGWSNKGQSTLPPPSSLDLRSSLNMKNSVETQSQEVEVSHQHITNHFHCRRFDSSHRKQATTLTLATFLWPLAYLNKRRLFLILSVTLLVFYCVKVRRKPKEGMKAL